ncbi:hypothetical protein LTS08_005614 [Lithohypha guttulata]|uniref:Cupin type-2 domain-containing protein n=1 Tax=Lithohypha guttulata TaxID=1690604 RepID=A0AAN7T141_9EURO|nr:hypothetical protein LTR51_003215 [Lithohypha guttulata]KAK5087037.1 hypothetical protein LTR05_004208 [Lithohypha guttulata]KAK5099899.1 hypothetical protein LTS08_005614 [Lithohypha guttulata]
MPESVRVTRASEVEDVSSGQTDGMIRQSAIVNLITPQQIVGTLMRAQSHSSSAIHHHGNQDTIVYAVSGRGAIVSEGGEQVHKLEPGDWALIPKGREHQEVNEGDEEVVWVICRAPGGTPEVVNLVSISSIEM